MATTSSAANLRRFQNLALLTIGATIFLVMVGGIVRMTGSGMGCPDWPRCFGQWIPPTDISQLPEDYKTRFAVQGREIADFDAFKTWVEYANRLVGVLIGLFIIGTTVAAYSLRSFDKRIFQLSIGALIGVLFEGWLGAKVVSTDLAVWMVTIHMVAALVIILLLVMAWLFAAKPTLEARQITAPRAHYRRYMGAVWAVLGITLLQIVLGTQVREAVDEVAKELLNTGRETWTEKLGAWYGIHRTFYFVVVIGVAAVFYLLRSLQDRSVNLLLWGMFGTLCAEIVLGYVLHYFALPPLAQPLHLTLGVVLFTIECGLLGILSVLLRRQNS